MLAWAGADADELIVPPAVERDRIATVAYRFAAPATGHGFLDVEWSDTARRIVDRRRLVLDLTGASQVEFPLDAKRAVTIKNRLTARLSFDAAGEQGNTIHRVNQETASFVATPPDRGWSDYQIIMWQEQTPEGYATLKKLGVTGGALEANRRDELSVYATNYLARLADADLRCYLENIATDFYSPYHRWYDDRPVNWRFLEAKERYWANPRDRGAFAREPSLSDEQWLEKIRTRLTRSVQALRPYRPLYYNLGDETGIADLAAFWDFDLSDTSLTAMRAWLKQSYGSLEALNRQWGTAFARWDAVVPMTTDEAMERTDRNFSAWADFKEWMDIAFGRALKSGTDAVHAADPEAVAAIEGAQIPGWGGYDYSRLADSVDAMELYDFGDNIPIARSFNPDLIMLTTSVKSGPAEAHRVWRELLRGTRGLILWDERHGFAGEDGTLGERGREAAPYFEEIRSGIGALLINSQRHTDPVGILYSPASRRVQWLLDRRATGDSWSRRSASTEYEDDTIRAGTRHFASALQHMGLQYRFVSSEGIRNGLLRKGGYRALILPHAIALTPDEAGEIREFAERGGLVIADSEPGLFDEHGRSLPRPLLSELFHGPASRSAVSFAFGKGRAVYLASPGGGRRNSARGLAEILEAGGIRPLISLLALDGRPASDVETYVFESGELTIVAMQRDDAALSASPEKEAFELRPPRPLEIYDIRGRHALGKTDRVQVELGPVEPVLLSLSERPIARPLISGPQRARRGENIDFRIVSDAPAKRAVIHLDVVDPEGNTNSNYSRNILVGEGGSDRLLPLAFNDETGIWRLRVTDLSSGASATAVLEVEP